MKIRYATVTALLIGATACTGAAAHTDVPTTESIRALIADARASGVPERYAPAEALIGFALAERPEDPELLTLRATVKQATHDFTGALADLDRVLDAQPNAPQARLTRAFLRATTGDAEGASADCAALPATVGKLVRAACIARVLDVQGHAKEATALLTRASAGTPPALRAWVHELLAAFSERAGDPEAAATHHEALRALAPADERYAVAHSAFLRRAGQPLDALARLPQAETDAGLLERTLAKQALGLDASAERAVLDARFAADLAAGHDGHLRETARYYLDVLGDAEGAYRLAKRNWALQKEPEDRALLLDTAAAQPAPRLHLPEQSRP